jgi:hypothetical protein
VLWREGDVEFFKALGENRPLNKDINIPRHAVRENLLSRGQQTCLSGVYLDPIKYRQGSKTNKSGRLLVLGGVDTGWLKSNSRIASYRGDQVVFENHSG